MSSSFQLSIRKSGCWRLTRMSQNFGLFSGAGFLQCLMSKWIATVQINNSCIYYYSVQYLDLYPGLYWWHQARKKLWAITNELESTCSFFKELHLQWWTSFLDALKVHVSLNFQYHGWVLLSLLSLIFVIMFLFGLNIKFVTHYTLSHCVFVGTVSKLSKLIQ